MVFICIPYEFCICNDMLLGVAYNACKKGETESVPLDYIVNEKRTLGKMQYEEKAIAIIFQ